MSELEVPTYPWPYRNPRGEMQPGAESVGPPLTDLVVMLHRAADGLEALTRQARAEARERMVSGMAQVQGDANGDASLWLMEVPQGATGYLMLCAVDEPGVTPSNPDTSANLWHAIYASSQGKDATAAQVAAAGQLLDCRPNAPTPDAQIPFAYSYGDRYGAPSIVGPGSFFLVVDAAAASRKLVARFNVLLVQPEP